MNPTPEQVKAVDLFRTGTSLAVEAGAGTGKTSTLVLMAESAAPTGRRGQYVAFNKAIVTEAGGKLPRNVVASTAHSLAFRAVGRHYQHRLRAPRMRSIDLARLLGVDPIVVTYGVARKVLQPSYLAGLVMRTITNFCQTADPRPTVDHVPYVDGIDMPDNEGHRTWVNNREVRRHIIGAVEKAWVDIANVDGGLPFKHEHYLKLWQLEGPRIAGDFILFDEAQDANPVMVAIVAAQTHAQLVWVGDSQQQIYGFTGAINALANVPAEQRTFLTQSFRFGDEIAEVANDLLGRLGAELRLRGSPNLASVVGPVAMPEAMLTRTNAAALEIVLDELTRERKPALVGGGQELSSFARGVKSLQEEGWTSHPDLACFDSWREVVDYVGDDPQGGELKLFVSLVESYGVATILRALDASTSEQNADVIVSTAHKAKGREWASVQLGADFPTQDDDPGAEELRLLYVAVTRARLELDVTAVDLLNDEPDEKKLLGLYTADEVRASAGLPPLVLDDERPPVDPLAYQGETHDCGHSKRWQGDTAPCVICAARVPA